MNIYKLISLFGKEYKDQELIKFFKEDGLDIVSEIRDFMETDYYEDAESSVYASSMKDGFDLVFEDELDYLDIEDGRYGESGNYYFTCIHIYSRGVDGYQEYKGELINGIKITNTREEIRTLMKEPYKRHESLDVDIWNNIHGCQIFVDYRERNTPYIISISMEKNKSDMDEKLTLSQLSNIIQWSGLKTVEEIVSVIIPICDSNQEYLEYKELFENIQQIVSDEKLKDTMLPNELVSKILDDLGMVVFYRKNSNILSSLSYEQEGSKLRLCNEWSAYIREYGFESVIDYNYEDETIMRASDALMKYGYENIEKVYERTRVEL